MNVVLCSPGLTFQADAPHSTRQRANAMAAQGLKVTVVGFPPTFPTDSEPGHFDYVSVIESLTPQKKQRWLLWKQKLGPYWTHVIEPFLVKRAAFRHARQMGADVLYVAHVEPWMFFGLAWLNRLSKRPVPTVAHIPTVFKSTAGRSLSARIRGWLNQTTLGWLPRVSHLICDNVYVARLLKIDHCPVTHLIPEGHRESVNALTQAEARIALGIPAGKKMLLLFGVANHHKGADILFKAMEGLNPEFMVYVVGKTGGVYEASWGSIDHLKQQGWKNDLTVVSKFVSEEDMSHFYSACDGIVIPYRWGFATTSGGLIKAVEYGKAVIGCNQYFIGSHIQENNLGMVFEPENVEALRHCLQEFAKKQEPWFEEVRRNSRRVAQEKSWFQIGILHRQLFEQMVASKKQS
jgi:glycosyltransferase involved in cell wall biosynthesis